VPFPSEHYAETAMRAIGVDPAFTDSKTKKHYITRQMHIDVLEDAAYLTIKFTAPESSANALRTCMSSFLSNVQLVC
jgi:predicted ATP-dependent Lon-type protease